MMVTIISLRGPTNTGLKGGARNYIEDFSTSLTNKYKEVTIICCEEKGKELPSHETISGVTIIRIKKGKNSIRSLKSFYKKNYKEKTTLLIENMVSYPMFIGSFDKKKKKFSIIHHLTGNEYLKRSNKLEGIAGYLLENLCLRVFYKNIPIITVSDESVKDIVKVGIKKNNISCIPPGIDTDYFIPAEKTKHPLIVYVGRYDGENGVKKINDLVKAFNLVNKKNTKLILAGPTNFQEELSDLISNNDNIEYKGLISEGEKLELLQKSWAFASPSSREGFGITYIEANSCGTPIIAYKINDLETLTDTNSFLADQGDIEELSLILKRISNGEITKDVNEIRNFALQYSKTTFSEKVLKYEGEL
ncbi:glycosyltransferase family 4 protein [Bacillus sp. Marseille-P3800]|uniref:glycosyltransferase family 4 protein n=1 Tax=Bacillus sp. Marseille-P3800 TaxID=2014782 RepID=UPI000C07401D|nr:glycosyltransferase family 4 protein [Bacillus sp. Marseille-P3800]